MVARSFANDPKMQAFLNGAPKPEEAPVAQTSEPSAPPASFEDFEKAREQRRKKYYGDEGKKTSARKTLLGS
jgi:hypothetical protein